MQTERVRVGEAVPPSPSRGAARLTAIVRTTKICARRKPAASPGGTTGTCQPKCDDGNACTVNTCRKSDGVCSNVPRDCGDSNPCTDDFCAVNEDYPGKASCFNLPIKGCCREEEDYDGDPCTKDSCNLIDNICQHVRIGGCCLVDEECQAEFPNPEPTCTKWVCALPEGGEGSSNRCGS